MEYLSADKQIEYIPEGIKLDTNMNKVFELKWQEREISHLLSLCPSKNSEKYKL